MPYVPSEAETKRWHSALEATLAAGVCPLEDDGERFFTEYKKLRKAEAPPDPPENVLERLAVVQEVFGEPDKLPEAAAAGDSVVDTPLPTLTQKSPPQVEDPFADMIIEELTPVKPLAPKPKRSNRKVTVDVPVTHTQVEATDDVPYGERWPIPKLKRQATVKRWRQSEAGKASVAKRRTKQQEDPAAMVNRVLVNREHYAKVAKAKRAPAAKAGKKVTAAQPTEEDLRQVHDRVARSGQKAPVLYFDPNKAPPGMAGPQMHEDLHHRPFLPEHYHDESDEPLDEYSLVDDLDLHHPESDLEGEGAYYHRMGYARVPSHPRLTGRPRGRMH